MTSIELEISAGIQLEISLDLNQIHLEFSLDYNVWIQLEHGHREATCHVANVLVLCSRKIAFLKRRTRDRFKKSLSLMNHQ